MTGTSYKLPDTLLDDGLTIIVGGSAQFGDRTLSLSRLNE